MKYNIGDLVQISREVKIDRLHSSEIEQDELILGVILYGSKRSMYIMDRPYRIEDCVGYSVLHNGKIIYADEAKIFKRISKGA